MYQKGVYPYDYINTWERLHEDTLPSRENFNSILRTEECSEEDYNRAKHVWDAIGCQSFLDYHNFYLKADVLQLADIFENFREICMKEYGLDPVYYVSAPSLTWDAMLKITKEKLQLVSDPEMFRMIDGGLRGGICMITKRYARANNPQLGEHYNPNLPKSYIVYLDANNLYGWAMSQALPSDGFMWLQPAEYENINWLQQTDTQEYGYIVECDREYPAELHDLHNEYPLAPERMDISTTMISETQVEIRKCYTMNQNGTSTKLVPNLFNKTKYCCHYQNLKFYLEHGLKLTKVHRVLRFKQSQWLAQYIIINQNLRAQSKNDFDKDFFKLMNNAVFGKTCENLKKRKDEKLCTTEEQCRKWTQKPNCNEVRIFGEDLVGIEMQKLQTKIDRPFYVGFAVLELSKLLMYRFHYDYIKTKYGDKAQLLFTDTDSLMYQIETEGNIYEEMYADKHLFDFAGYPHDSPYYNADNNKIIGKMKDEAGGKPILEFVGLRPKMYSFTWIDGDHINEKHRVKGIPPPR